MYLVDSMLFNFNVELLWKFIYNTCTLLGLFSAEYERMVVAGKNLRRWSPVKWEDWS